MFFLLLYLLIKQKFIHPFYVHDVHEDNQFLLLQFLNHNCLLLRFNLFLFSCFIIINLVYLLTLNWILIYFKSLFFNLEFLLIIFIIFYVYFVTLLIFYLILNFYYLLFNQVYQFITTKFQ